MPSAVRAKTEPNTVWPFCKVVQCLTASACFESTMSATIDPDACRRSTSASPPRRSAAWDWQHGPRAPTARARAGAGGGPRLGSISKQGDRYLRSLFVAGALAVIRYAKLNGTKYRPWVAALLARRPTKVAAIALANKLARMAWAMMARASDTIIQPR
jgi:transposase IS116/IS110/IS902 family protein